jgi:hypothetical protein
MTPAIGLNVCLDPIFIAPSTVFIRKTPTVLPNEKNNHSALPVISGMISRRWVANARRMTQRVNWARRTTLLHGCSPPVRMSVIGISPIRQ